MTFLQYQMPITSIYMFTLRYSTSAVLYCVTHASACDDPTPRLMMGGGDEKKKDPGSLKERETKLRNNVTRLSEDADEPTEVAAALTAIRRELRTSPEGPSWVVKVSIPSHRRRRPFFSSPSYSSILFLFAFPHISLAISLSLSLCLSPFLPVHPLLS